MSQFSVIIPVRNGAATLARCLTCIKQQSVASQIEIIVLDSMSTDTSREIAKSFSAKIIDIPNGAFNHGLTRNLAVQNANGELLYFTVQDAYLAEDNQLEKMAGHFTDMEVQSVTGMQAIPNDLDKNPAMWFRRFSQPIPEIKQFPKNSFRNLPPKKQLENCGWDNVNSMYRKSALKTLPFQKTDFAEDALWARDALQLGWKIIRDPSMVAYHYHHQTFKYNFKTSFITNYTFWKHFNIMPANPFHPASFMRNISTLLKRKQLSSKEKIVWIIHNGIRHLADISSVFIFRMVYLLGKQKLLDKAYQYFCAEIPQGALQKQKMEQSSSFPVPLRRL